MTISLIVQYSLLDQVRTYAGNVTKTRRIVEPLKKCSHVIHSHHCPGAVIKRLRGHKEWLLSRRSKKKKITSPATAESDKNNNKKTNFLAILESLGEDAGNKMDEDAPKDVAKDFTKDVAAAAGEKEEEEEEDDFDSRSAITNKGLRGVCVKKEQRKKLKKQLWLKSLYLLACSS